MKTLKLLFITLFIISFTACSSEDDSNDNNNPTDTNADLTGTWNLEGLNVETESVSTIQGQSFTSTSVGEGTNIDYQMIFSENPNEVIGEGSFDMEFTITFAGQTQTETLPGEPIIGDLGTWTREGNNLIISINGETPTYEITQLTESTLVLNVTQVDEVTEQGVTTVATSNGTLTLSRL